MMNAFGQSFAQPGAAYGKSAGDGYGKGAAAASQIRPAPYTKPAMGLGKKCFCCGGDHAKADCPVKDFAVCETCGKQGHTKETCEAGCFACGGNHNKADCPVKDSAVCELCGKAGHTQVKCDKGVAGSAKVCFACGGDHQKAQCPNLNLSCESCGKVGHMAAMCQASGEGKGLGKGCFACGGNHQKADCPNQYKTCDICGKVGHLKFKCESPAVKGKGVGKAGISLVAAYSGGGGKDFGKGSAGKGCFACGGNHQKLQCPNLGKVCDICGKTGHLKAMCESAPAPFSAQAPFGKGAGKGEGKSDGCFACGGNHQKAQCPNLGKSCDLCGKVGHLKWTCESAGKGPSVKGVPAPFAAHGKGAPFASQAFGKGSGKGCFACGGDHQKAQCPNLGKTCDICGKTGHLKAMCEQSKGGKGAMAPEAAQAGKGGAQCYCCGSFDHQKFNCPFKSSTCGICGKYGHTAETCGK